MMNKMADVAKLCERGTEGWNRIMSENKKFLCFGKEVINVDCVKRIRVVSSGIEIEFTDGVTRCYQQSSIENTLDRMSYLLKFFENL